ncbi:MAG TPA: hypothetical protein VM935_16820, partial [Chitinophagaceae bacterium]|nr:hypothetical protein [Chitinophagaceae bacterium]
MQLLNKFRAGYNVVLLVALLSCSKSSDTSSSGGNNGGGNGATNSTTCTINTISQVNSGVSAEASISAIYNSNFDVIKLIIYDSASKTKTFEANFNYIGGDTVRMNQHQYMLLDGNKRVIRFITKSDMADLANADDYIFEYMYNSDGYLTTKNLFINGSQKANFSTVYSYADNKLTGCIMSSPSAGHAKVLESTLSYDNSISAKNWIYTFPDAMEGYVYATAMNFGKRVANPLSKVVTRIYNPVSG